MIPCSAGVASTSSVIPLVATHQRTSSTRFDGPWRSRRAGPTRRCAARLTGPWCRSRSTSPTWGPRACLPTAWRRRQRPDDDRRRCRGRPIQPRYRPTPPPCRTPPERRRHPPPIGRHALAATREIDAPVLEPADRVDLVAVLRPDPDLEVQVVAGALALAADEADQLPGLDLLALLHEVFLLVPVHGDRAVGVLDHDRVAEAAHRAGLDHGAVAGRVERGALGRGHVDAVVERAPARLEAGRDDELALRDRQHPLRPGRLDQRDLPGP